MESYTSQKLCRSGTFCAAMRWFKRRADAGHGPDGGAEPELSAAETSRPSPMRLRLCSLASMFGSALSARDPTPGLKCSGMSRARLRKACAQNLALPGPFVAQNSATEWIDDPCTYARGDPANAECCIRVEVDEQDDRGREFLEEHDDVKFSCCCLIWSSDSVEFSGSFCLIGFAACLHTCAEG